MTVRTLSDIAKGALFLLASIAFLLGFSDAFAFHKALRRWTVRAPGEYVRELRKRGRAAAAGLQQVS